MICYVGKSRLIVGVEFKFFHLYFIQWKLQNTIKISKIVNYRPNFINPEICIWSSEQNSNAHTLQLVNLRKKSNQFKQHLKKFKNLISKSFYCLKSMMMYIVNSFKNILVWFHFIFAVIELQDLQWYFRFLKINICKNNLRNKVDTSFQ